MCVIIVKNKGQKLPPYELLLAAYRANPDGCGFVSEKRSFKSLNFDSFYNHLKWVGDDEGCIIHFRWATNGSVCKKNCHPFKADDIAFAHNGILDITPDGDMTDSETALQRIIAPAIARFGWGSEIADAVIDDVRGGSRFAFMRKGDIRLYGNFQTFGAWQFSNLNWMYQYRAIVAQKRRYQLA